MAVRGLILLTALALASGADDLKFTDCKALPAGMKTKSATTNHPYQLTAAAPNNGSIEVTVIGSMFKYFRIVAMEQGKETMPKGSFMLAPDAKAMLMDCGAMKMAAVVNKDPADDMTPPFTVMWKAMSGYEGALKFKLTVVENATMFYEAESGEQTIPKQHSNGGNGHKDAGDAGKDAHSKGTASCSGLSSWLVAVALGLVAVLGLGHNLPAS
ncbi:uncharacterized protein LOC119180967 [Rhipicephalus microplus]|uniref:uncharacterized protein LOC119180967 n=1 Tax=Rhipicephalus microplus TaxID=6941 RepID=UPI003F6B3372